jgi:hypothetical protein
MLASAFLSSSSRQVLVTIFQNTFRGEDQKHLRNFYIIGALPWFVLVDGSSLSIPRRS